MMKLLLLSLVVSGQWAFSTELILKPGASLTCPAKGDIVRCENLPTCTLKKRFVGKSWMVFLPSGKEHGDFDTEEEAVKELKKLFDIKVCEKTNFIKE